jgi:hypothetical protein
VTDVNISDIQMRIADLVEGKADIRAAIEQEFVAAIANQEQVRVIITSTDGKRRTGT